MHTSALCLSQQQPVLVTKVDSPVDRKIVTRFSYYLILLDSGYYIAQIIYLLLHWHIIATPGKEIFI